MSRLITMVEVARLAGVSPSTVSHVINETRYVRPETRQVVLDTISRTGYTHNTIARALATASTNSIGLASAFITNAYFTELIYAVEGEAARHGHTLLVGDTGDDPDQELRIVRALCERRVDGLLIAPAGDPGQRAIAYAAEQGVPLVLVDRLASDRFDQVGVENVESTASLVDHLVGLGHRRIGMVYGLEGLRTTIERVEGYRVGLRRGGLDYDPHLIASGKSLFEPAQRAAGRLLDLPVPPTALVVGNNVMTVGVMGLLRERGVRVPGDLALTSFDDFQWADSFSPRLTTLAQPSAALGAKAVQLLMGRLASPDRRPQTVRLEPTFMHRDSCGCDPQTEEES